MGDRLLILGASARAAAASSRRAGLEPFAIDLFADRDTQLLCNSTCCPPDEYPEGLFRIARRAPPMPWMYTGGLENYPELIGELARERELWGNGPDVLKKVRDPLWLDRVIDTTCKVEYPRIILPGSHAGNYGRWVRKPFKGSGGQGVRTATPLDFEHLRDPSVSFYLQEVVDGLPLSAIIACDGQTEWGLGVTRQLIGEPWLHAKRYAYCGTVSQTEPEAAFTGYVYERPWVEAELIARAVLYPPRLSGVCGVDYIAGRSGPVVLEVNPRYTASIETVEYSTGTAFIDWHLQAYTDRKPTVYPLPNANHSVGKAIYYAARSLAFPASGPWDDSLAHVTDVWRRPDFADIPHPGDVIEAGHPVLTIFAEADDEAECLRRLQSRAAELDRLFGVTP